jgi:hypothetical protein
MPGMPDSVMSCCLRDQFIGPRRRRAELSERESFND